MGCSLQTGLMKLCTVTAMLMSVQEDSAGMLHSPAKFNLLARKRVT